MKKVLFLALSLISSTCHAQDLSITRYFQDLSLSHLDKFVAREKATFDTTCQQLGLGNTNAENIKNYYTLEILHRLFTTTSCQDGSSGEILNMPYFWHYRTPNPRDEILVDGRINIEYTRIERKPYVFLKDMVAPRERFTHPDWGSFSSFGWCSEREMAFVCLLTLMGYTAHVIAPGPHAWTEIEIPFYTARGGAKTVLVSIDNTFNRVTYSMDAPSDHNNIYNTRAMASAEIARVRALTVTPQARARIDAAIDIYLDTK